MDYRSIGGQIQKYRVQKHLHQDQLAEQIGLSANYLGQIERGEKTPSLETFIAILNSLEISADQVLADVLIVGYKYKNSDLDGKLQRLTPIERNRIYAVIDTLLNFPDK